MMRKFLLAMAVMAGLVAPGLVASGAGADPTGSRPFSAIGTVADAAAPVAPTPIEGENASFILNPVHQASLSAREHVTAAGLQVYVTPTTFYYRQDETGAYRRSTYGETVVVGADVRVAGLRFTRDDGTVRFIARAVWNPPNDPPPPRRQPECGVEQGLRNQAYNVKATIVSTTVHYPCTGFGGYPGGFKLEGFTETPRADVARGIEAYGHRLEVYVTPLTKYYEGDSPSTWGRVVRRGNEVRVLGRYQHAAGAWIFVAETVYTPPPDRRDTFNPRTRVEAFQTGATNGNAIHYEGPSNGPSFGAPDGRFEADIVWTPIGEGPDFTATGTWVLTNGRNVLRGTLDGETKGSAFDLSLDVTGGEGQWYGSTGGGDMEGQVTPGMPPAAFTGDIRLSVIKTP
jgi:hypothetical protein